MLLILIEILALLLCLRLVWKVVRRAFFVVNDFDNVPGPKPTSRIKGELRSLPFDIVSHIIIRIDSQVLRKGRI